MCSVGKIVRPPAYNKLVDSRSSLLNWRFCKFQKFNQFCAVHYRGISSCLGKYVLILDKLPGSVVYLRDICFNLHWSRCFNSSLVIDHIYWVYLGFKRNRQLIHDPAYQRMAQRYSSRITSATDRTPLRDNCKSICLISLYLSAVSLSAEIMNGRNLN